MSSRIRCESFLTRHIREVRDGTHEGMTRGIRPTKRGSRDTKSLVTDPAAQITHFREASEQPSTERGMSEEASVPALKGLENEYEISGELRGTDAARYYIGRKRDDHAAEVAIMVFANGKDAENNATSHFASDAQILERNGHPSIPRVLGGKWLDHAGFALITERVVGETLEERLERGEKFTNPALAMMLQEINSILDWAREAGVVHRGVTPDTIFFERGSNRMRVAFVPTPVPMSGLPDAASDARTLGALAWSVLTGKPYDRVEMRSLGDVCPNLATRVIESTDRMLRSKDHAEAPDAATYIGILAAGDVMKQAEVELAAQKEEYDEQHAAALKACEVQRQQVEQHAQEQLAMLAGEKEDFKRQMSEERAAMDAERAQMQTLLAERKDRLGAVRAELDQQRIELERRLAELEQYRAEVEKVRDDALAAREEAKAAVAKAAEAAAAHNAAVKAAAASAASAAVAASTLKSPSGSSKKNAGAKAEKEIPVPAELADMPAPMKAAPIVIPELEPLKAPKLAKPPKAPKWGKMAAVDLEHTDEENITPPGKPRWMLPAGVATLVLILIAAVYAAMHRTRETPDTIRLGKSTVVPTAPRMDTGIMLRGGFLSQSAGGEVGARFNNSPAMTPADSAAAAAAAAAPGTAVVSADSAARTDSIAAARARRAAREAAAREDSYREERRRARQAEIDSLNSPSSTWNRNPRPQPAEPTQPPTSYTAPPPTGPVPSGPRSDTVYRRGGLIRPDGSAIRPDSSVRPDTAASRHQ